MGLLICEGEIPRPRGNSLEYRRELRLAGSAVLEDRLELDFPAGTSRMLSLRPVVGSTTDSCAGSWETWYPSMMYFILVSYKSQEYIKKVGTLRTYVVPVSLPLLHGPALKAKSTRP
jgi:hypothetical protein